ncbi:LysR substrate-binding domain-containing protein [Bordetella flabilis]|jgi:DNA-binding transcriptional LysR family regulator|uniref:LysR family transcriptional regulator n=1 Tax=Bordetella flabilis TaxID=463014 RepID=A0A193GJN2_9BORD|nr:LysR substrate-binding domain-containing protein [Bordetella flabilis]ANN79474.1 LysR family transcriptional regulator [Bordetella flabilis]
MLLNLRQIEVFRAVMTTGSISGAAKLLFVSQPAVSRLLAHTEQRLGFSLFERIKGRLYPTPEARQLFREVEHVYAGVRRVGELAGELAERRSGILHVVSSPSIGHMLIPLAITAFRAAHEDVKVTFQALAFRPLTQMLLDNRAELGVVILPAQHPNLIAQPIGEARLVCICPYNHPLAHRAMLTIEDLLPYPLISYGADTPFGSLVEQMYQEAGQPRRVAVEVSSPQNACSLVQAGAGIAIVDQFSVRSRTSGEFVVRPIAQSKVLTASLLQSRFEPLSQLAQAFVDTLRATMREQGFELASGQTRSAGQALESGQTPA